ncbi:c-type cytochrome [Nitrosophilus alvini]|uniref:c-type cytochrome n=1 Tax=Nitrosophilus alvini TaxID=2714855 RepID=UPI001909C4BA|nr:c-type cytochrome [Nitrosophilus alvini]
MKKLAIVGLIAAGAMSLMAADGAALYKKCAGCHGAKGEKKALGKSAPIGGWDVAKLVEDLKGYKAGTRNVYGMGALMKGQVASYSDADIQAVAEYIHGLK